MSLLGARIVEGLYEAVGYVRGDGWGPRTHTRRVRRLARVILLLCALVLAWWPDHHQLETTTRTITHPNGLTLTIDRNFSVRQTQAGYILDLKKVHDSRYPQAIEVRLEDGPRPGAPNVSSPSELAGSWRKVIVERGENYWIEGSEGAVGSGGPERTLTAWQPCSDKHVLVIQHAQAERESDLDFQDVFQILRTVRCPTN